MLVLKNIVKDYYAGDTKVRALNDVSIAFRKNEFVSILGQSGCGKTTLLNIIGGLDRYTDGDLSIKGVSTKKYRDHDWDTYRNHSIGFVFQSYNLIPHQTVMSNVELSLTLTGIPKAERRRRAEEVLRRVGLGDQMYKKPSQMSGGQMQRVAIARALINDPEILLADEPTGALDTETSVQIMDILREISKDKLIIMVTHNPELAEKYSDRIIRLSDGKVIGDTAPYSAEEESRETYEPQSDRVADTGDAGTGNASETPRKSKKKRPSMSFFTALSLSLNNLMTKKTRTFMTSFAGSIGIIGIALILSLSNGINAYIGRVQRETLSSYPITLQKEEVDMASLITSLMGGKDKNVTDREDDKIYSSTVMYDLMTTMINPDMNSNNLRKFKSFLESGESKIPEHTVLIRYGYDIDINAYLMDKNGNYFKADVMALYAEMASNMGMSTSGGASQTSSMSGMSVGSGYRMWSELLPPAEKGEELIHDMVKEQYDVIAGRWPENKQEIVLVVTENNEISDMALYSLGLVSTDEMYDAIIAAFKGEAPDTTEPLCFSYDELLGIKYKLIPTCDYYYRDAEGEWKNADLEEDKTRLNSIISEGLDLEIVGIIRQNPDATAGSVSGSLAYTYALTEYLISVTAESEIVNVQIGDGKTDVFTGLPFVIEEDDKLSDAAKPEAFKAYIETLSVQKKAELYSRIITTPSDEYVEATVTAYLGFLGISKDSTKEELKEVVLTQLGDTDPTLLEKYFDSFDRDNLYDFIVNMIGTMVRTDYADKAGKLISDIENAPTDAELDAEAAVVILDVVPAESRRIFLKSLLLNTPGTDASGVDTMPDVQVTQTLVTLLRAYGQSAPQSSGMSSALIYMTDAEARKTFVAEIYKSKTELSDEVIDEELGKLSAMQLTDIFRKEVEKLAKENYLVAIAPTQNSAAKNAKLAAAFDKEAAEYTDAQMIAYYDAYVPTESDSSLKDNLRLLGYADKDDPTTISIYAKDFEYKEKITDLIREYNREQENEDDRISYTDYIGLLMSSVTNIVNGITYALVFFVSISLVVSSIMIGIITYISVLERTKEIGILRAMGASKKDISRVFNAETLIVGFVSGVIGISVTLVLNIPIGLIIKAIADISGIAVLPFWGAVALVLISMGLTLIAGLIPSGFAAKRDPVESLRSE